MLFKLKSDYQPTGDQPQAIDKLVNGVKKGKKHQTLLGVTGSGKTFTIANLIQKTQKPTLIISHNKTLAAQLYQEFRDYFPDNAVSYFVSYYDYYQPEAYIPQTDTYIEKETDINDEIDKLRLSATANLLTRPDTIVIASVSCIYNLGSPVEYGQYVLELLQGQVIDKRTILSRLTDLQYQRSDYEFTRGVFQLKGDVIHLYPAYTDYALRIEMLDNQIENLDRVDPISLKPLADSRPSGPKREAVYPAKHYLTNPVTQKEAIATIKKDLRDRILQFKKDGKVIEAYRIEQKVIHDLEMIEKLGYVGGIENYSRYFDGRKPGEPPYSLIDYFHQADKKFKTNGFLTVVDESHITLPQVRGMYAGDQSRKKTLIEYGFRLPSALDNRPLTFTEFQRRVPQVLYTSATPNEYEISLSGGVVQQLVRPTGLIDPEIEIKTTKNQIEDLIIEIKKRVKKGQRVLVTTLTKKTAEALTEYLQGDRPSRSGVAPAAHSGMKTKIKVQYLHADVNTLDRSDILEALRKGEYDVVVGINLLREGLDLPEVSLVAILDADKEGFLRSTTSLIQTMGRAARHLEGKVIMYADQETKSMKAAIAEVKRRRQIQVKYNLQHQITPVSIQKPIREQLIKREPKVEPQPNIIQLSKNQAVDLKNLKPDSLTPLDKTKLIRGLTRKMQATAKIMDFEQAAKLRDTINLLSD
jgi:excinuclease ABC subunit B